MLLFIYLFFNFCWMGLFLFLKKKILIIFILLMMIIFIILFNKIFMYKILMNLIFLISFSFFFFNKILNMYMMFELSMLSIIFLVMLNGMQIEKLKSLFYLFFYMIFCSFPFLFIIFFINFNIFNFMELNNFFCFFFIFLFLMKIPMYFLHNWLPKVHVEASTESSILLAGILLKLGCFGIFFFLEIFNKNFLIFPSLLGLIFVCFYCIFQSDLKCFIAFSSIFHMSFLLLNFFLMLNNSKMSSFLMMISHGYISVIIFYLGGELVHNNYSRLIYFLNSLFVNFIFFWFFLIFFLMFNFGLPLNLSFFSELNGIYSIFYFSKFLIFIFFIYFFFNFFCVILMITYLHLGYNYFFFNMKFLIYIFSFVLYIVNFMIF